MADSFLLSAAPALTVPVVTAIVAEFVPASSFAPWAEVRMSTRGEPIQFPGSQAFVGVMTALTRYLSTRTAITLTNQALTELGLTPESMGRSDVKQLVELMRPGLRVFCNEGDVDRLLVALLAVESGSPPSEVVAANRAQRARQVTVRLPRGGEG